MEEDRVTLRNIEGSDSTGNKRNRELVLVMGLTSSLIKRFWEFLASGQEVEGEDSRRSLHSWPIFSGLLSIYGN